MQIHNLPAQTTAADADALAIDNGTTTQKITTANLGKKVAEDAKPAYTSGDNASPSAWTSVAVMTSGEAMKSILNKVSTMFKNIRWLYKMLGTTDISSLSTDHTVTGALAKLNTDIGSLKSIPANRGPCVYKRTVSGDGAALVFGKRGQYAVLCMCFVNGGTPYIYKAIETSTDYVSVSVVDGYMTITISEYVDCRIISRESAANFVLVTT